MRACQKARLNYPLLQFFTLPFPFFGGLKNAYSRSVRAQRFLFFTFKKTNLYKLYWGGGRLNFVERVLQVRRVLRQGC